MYLKCHGMQNKCYLAGNFTVDDCTCIYLSQFLSGKGNKYYYFFDEQPRALKIKSLCFRDRQTTRGCDSAIYQIFRVENVRKTNKKTKTFMKRKQIKKHTRAFIIDRDDRKAMDHPNQKSIERHKK